MDNIQFTFKHDLNTDFLEITGTKIFNNKKFICGAWDKIDNIDLQEMLNKITMSIQDKIIEDLSSKDEPNGKTIISIEGIHTSTEVFNAIYSSEIIYEPNGIYVKFKERK